MNATIGPGSSWAYSGVQFKFKFFVFQLSNFNPLYRLTISPKKKKKSIKLILKYLRNWCCEGRCYNYGP